MLKKRLIAILPIREQLLVQSICFKRFLPVGDPLIAVEYLNQWGIDELVVVDIRATVEGRKFDLGLIHAIAQRSLVPLTIGGGISSTDDMREIIKAGADKICINTAAFLTPQLIRDGAEIFGRQAIVVALDVRDEGNDCHRVYSHSGGASTNLEVTRAAKMAEEFGAGELFLQSIDRDGTKQGYDIALAKKVAKAVNIPVILCGGVGHSRHLLEGLHVSGIDAVCAGNFFHYTEQSVIVAKSFLQSRGIEIRLDTQCHYEGFQFDEQGRVLKKDDQALLQLRFQHVEDEKI